MAEENKDILTRLADRGEQVVGRITDLPGAKSFVDRTTAMAKRLDDIQRRLRALDPLEQRVTSIEKRLDKLEGKGASRPRKAATRKKSTTSKAAAKPASAAKASTKKSS